MKVDIKKKSLLYFKIKLKIVVLRFNFPYFFFEWSEKFDIYFGAKTIDVNF